MRFSFAEKESKHILAVYNINPADNIVLGSLFHFIFMEDSFVCVIYVVETSDCLNNSASEVKVMHNAQVLFWSGD